MSVHEQEVPVEQWREHAQQQAQQGRVQVVFLAGVDVGSGHIQVMTRLCDATGGDAVTVRTTIGATETLDSIVESHPGADWYERETHDLLGVQFRPDRGGVGWRGDSDDPPLLRRTALGARLDHEWPGSQDPGHDGQESPRRRRPRQVPGNREEWSS